ncbi:hypothetical protein PPTG_12351 [Phytophthora nicotianae INRA-310]|uniref:Uncharacterized protein n=1 Tax=Phytophthora nicotianae (strain INRA-310) TaxID=761204 RepID=W2Q6U7_PHYN3|nr:hypothetical protein PPTG_12351 [Phytophthora nicotianae INRA-310]ETN08586.1 hypothetical protein PPTG_12351 [Phytophthora nicotianae INRA-310]
MGKTQTIVIDKDFVEWSVTEECFPQATVIRNLPSTGVIQTLVATPKH